MGVHPLRWIAIGLVAVVVGAATSSGASATAGSSRVGGHAISLRLPAGWHGRLSVFYGSPTLQAANFPLPANLDATGEAAIRQLGSVTRIFFSLAEVANRPGTRGFDNATLPIQLRSQDTLTRDIGFAHGRVVVRRRFAVNGRSFALLAYFAAHADSRQALRRTNRVLVSLRVERLVAVATWSRLRRRLRMPALARGGACPRSPSGRAAPSVYFTLGSGPAYPVLGTRDGVAVLGAREKRGNVYWHKTLWAISPSYHGPLLIRGHRVGGAGTLRFSPGGGQPQRELQSPPTDGQAIWRYAPTTTLIPGGGCYLFQIDGTTFSRTIVFAARRSG